MLIICKSREIFIPLSAALLHECGHIFVMLLCNAGAFGIRITLFGAEIDSTSLAGLSALKRVLIYSAGAAVNLVSGIIAGGDTLFGLCSFVLAFINMLPVTSLDGGCVLYEILEYFFPLYCDFVMRIVSFVTVTALWLFAVWCVMLLKGNITVLAFAICLFAELFLRET